MRRLSVPLLAALVLASCTPAPPPTGQARADAATLAACREHADQVFNRNNRDTIYTISNPNLPFSANSNSGVTNRGLAQQFVRENMVRDCVRNTGTETDRSPTTSPPTATP
jgi:hypothetical protein